MISNDTKIRIPTKFEDCISEVYIESVEGSKKAAYVMVLDKGYRCSEDKSHTIIEFTIKNVKRRMKAMEPCDCSPECKRIVTLDKKHGRTK